MLNAVDALRLFCDGRTSMHDARALLMSIGHSRQDFADAFGVLSTEPGAILRVGSPQRDEMHAEIYLTAAEDRISLADSN